MEYVCQCFFDDVDRIRFKLMVASSAFVLLPCSWYGGGVKRISLRGYVLGGEDLFAMADECFSTHPPQ